MRSTHEVFEDHLARRLAGEVEEDLVMNYANGVVLITSEGVERGKEAVRAGARRLAHQVASAHFDYRTRWVDGEVAFLEWTAEGKGRCIEDGVDTFVIREGRIVVQTIHYTVRVRRRRASQGIRAPR